MASGLCPYCMKVTDQRVCRHCGKDTNYIGHTSHLPAGYVLNGVHSYVLGAVLGQGGFGITYIALDMDTGERVAIKEYFPGYCAGRTRDNIVTPYQDCESVFYKGRERFLDEAKTLKSLSDLDSIVNALDFFKSNNTAYLVMEFLEGESLKKHIMTKGAMPSIRFLNQIKPLMEDIHRMHQRGIIHRDIAPDNIILMPDGRLKLIDFGAARYYIGSATFTVVVKHGFSPIEQYFSRGITYATDVYALAATIYYCITGIVPTEAIDRQEKGKHPKSPRALGVDITSVQETALQKAMEVHQSNRYQSVKDFTDALYRNPTPPPPPPPPPLPTVRWKKLIATILPILTMLMIVKGCMALINDKDGPSDPTMPTQGYVEPTKHNHTWKAATCTTPESCIVCGEIRGVSVGHQWKSATCTSPKTCMVCGETSGTAASHQWVDATYTTPKTCKVCGTTTGSVKEKSLLDTPRSGLLAAGNYHSVHLYPNGRVIAEGRSTLSEYANKGTRLDVSSWSDIVAICASSHTVGLKADGTVVACGVNRYGQCDLSGWKDIVRIAVSDDHTVGLRRDGTVVAKGNNEYGQCDVSHWRNIMAIAATKTTTFGLTQDGTIVSAGRDHYGKSWHNIMEIYAGPYDLIGLRGDYSVIASGSCEKWDNNNMANWGNVMSVSASSTHIVGLRFDGTVVACGRESAAAACDAKYWKDIVQVSAGMYFTIGLKSDGTVVSCGDDVFGQLAIE